jgi:tetratricopeptide (TPR) repeat protein
MKTRFLPVVLVVFVAGVAFDAPGQTIYLRDGKKVVAKALRRQGDSIMAQSPKVDNTPEVQGEVGYPLSQIEKLEFPEPAVLRTAPDMIAQGKAADALAQLESPLNYYAGFRDAPGSYWADIAIFKLTALIALSKDSEAEPLGRQISQQATSPETVRAAQAHLAGIAARRGEHDQAIKILDQVLRESSTPATLAAAAVNKANSHYALKQWKRALLTYLQIPVFFPEQKAVIPQYMLGAGRCYFEVEDYARAKNQLNDLIKDYASTPEATLAKAELEKIARREKALETVK